MNANYIEPVEPIIAVLPQVETATKHDNATMFDEIEPCIIQNKRKRCCKERWIKNAKPMKPSKEIKKKINIKIKFRFLSLIETRLVMI
jgi:hypothetical protein